jgi:23S rRNA pseudouridine2605 synthase
LPGDRLQKVLAQAGLASRREAEQWIIAGRVTINGVRAELGQRVQGRDEIRIDGRVLRRARDPEKLSVDASTFLCNRSPGQSLTEELVPKLPRRAGKRFLAVSPMPNVDGGLELLTTDGALATRLQRRVRRWLTEFLIRVRGELTPESLDAIAGGQLDDGRKLSVLAVEGSDEFTEGANRWYRIEVEGASGKEIRQLFERQGALVSRILRTRLGALALTRDLNRGHFRKLTDEESQALQSSEAGQVPIGDEEDDAD